MKGNLIFMKAYFFESSKPKSTLYTKEWHVSIVNCVTFTSSKIPVKNFLYLINSVGDLRKQ